MASASDVKVAEAELETMEQMMDFFEEISSKFGAGAIPAIGPDSELGGMPVKVVSFRNGQPVATFVVTSVEKKDLPASKFEVPAGFEKQDLGIPKM